MPSRNIIELSIEDTDKLREKLGLAPLRLENTTSTTIKDEATKILNRGNKETSDKEELELSVKETNKLREKLGLAPLRNSDCSETKKKEIHKPAENIGEKEIKKNRIERAKLQREVEHGATQVFGSSTLGDIGDETSNNDGNDDKSALSWAAMMKQQKGTDDYVPIISKNKVDKAHNSKIKNKYDESNLKGLQVKNRISGLQAGENTVLTLADVPILESKSVSNKGIGINEEEDELENVNLTELERQHDGLRKKRMLENGMGRAGGYAGFDDEEFEELGGAFGPSREDRVENKHKIKGFRIGLKKNDDETMADFDKAQNGKSISLAWKGDAVSSDYMTIEEEEKMKDERNRKKKEAKFKKKKKKSKKRKKRTDINSEDDEDEENSNNPLLPKIETSTNVLSKLEDSAPTSGIGSLQKRRRLDDSKGSNMMSTLLDDEAPIKKEGMNKNCQQQLETKMLNYDKIMEKANERTRIAFGKKKFLKEEEDLDVMDDEPDDSYLNAALEKARRLNRLRGMNKSMSTGADAVAEAVKSTSLKSNDSNAPSGISFSIDDTREFSRAIQARTQQKSRETKSQTKDDDKSLADTLEKEEKLSLPQNVQASSERESEKSDDHTDDTDMEELAKHVVEEDDKFDGFTANYAGVGRGLSSFISMLKTTGEITGKHGGKEELRGRAKDERNYDNYESLDLSKIVSIGKNATEKDAELANREIKLEYRDKHGRLLTQKEAYRDLCYQFHGHGASKKKEEKRLKQIALEQAEARLASGQISAARDGGGGTLGALKATQKATGKAFIVHKT